MNGVAALIERLLGPSPTPAERVRAAARLRRTTIVGAVACLACGSMYLAVDAVLSSVATLLTGVVLVLIRLVLRPERVHAAMFGIATATTVGVVVASHDLGGLSSPAMVWLPILIRATYLLLGIRAALPSVALMIGAVAAMALDSPEVPIISETALDITRAGSLIVALIATFFSAAANERTSRAALRMLEEANATLSLARDAAETTSRLKSEFVATVSHELRTPLNAIVGMNGMLLDSALDDRQREYVQTTGGAASSLVLLVDDLLEMSRLEAGRVALQPAPCDLRVVVEGVRDMLALRARSKGLAIDVELPNDLPRVVGDVGRLRQVLTNLVDNAVKFTERGHVLVRVTAAAGTADSVDITIVVEDTGIGVPPEKIELIFERFRQADSSTTRRFGGTGLGLAIARELLALMDGTIAVRSAPGVGSTFTAKVTLPLALAVRSLDGTRVLLAEDNVVNQRLAVYLLTSLGCVVDVAGDGAEAVRLADLHPYDVVLMDCHMPEMDGYRAATAIRARFGDRLPILALTAAGSAEDVARAREAGMDELLQKPIDIEGIRAALSRVATASHV